MQDVELLARVYCVWLIVWIMFSYHDCRRQPSFVEKWLSPILYGFLLSVGIPFLFGAAVGLLMILFRVFSIAIFGWSVNYE